MFFLILCNVLVISTDLLFLVYFPAENFSSLLIPGSKFLDSLQTFAVLVFIRVPALGVYGLKFIIVILVKIWHRRFQSKNIQR